VVDPYNRILFNNKKNEVLIYARTWMSLKNITLNGGRSINGQKTHEEILNIPGHKGNANQNHIKIPPHSC
jgi:hypothetical protein